MAIQTTALLVAMLLIAGVSLRGINALHQDFGSALLGYRDLRSVFEVGGDVTTARNLLVQNGPDPIHAAAEIQRAIGRLELLPGDPSGNRTRTALLPPLRAAQEKLLRLLRLESADVNWAQSAADLDAVRGRLAALAADIRRGIERDQLAADARRRTTVMLTAVTSGIVVVLATLIGIVLYRGVTRPLYRLGEGARRIAAGHLSERLPAGSGDEFSEVASDFNRMAGELEGLYRDLEAKVAAKSKELVRSERLASVGYLAAGVAHEINNPLGIITGYAELMLKEAQANGHGDQEPARSLRVICEEAFRCKDITQKLLSLARGGGERRERLSLADLAREVVSIQQGLLKLDGRKIEVSTDPPDECAVRANAAEMKQVVLNLVINALDAVDPGGQVRVEVRRRGDAVELSVTDNGRGLSPQTLERVFEPFFTERRGARPPGTGLGLAIVHAIVNDHAGVIEARSDGIGSGSVFLLRLPAADANS